MTAHSLTVDFVELHKEYTRCAADPVYFIRNYVYMCNPLSDEPVKFILHPYQVKLVESLHTSEFNIINAPRQYGKTSVSLAFFLWYALFSSDKLVLIGTMNQQCAFDALRRLQFAYDNLPDWLQPGKLVTRNKKELWLANGSMIIANVANESFGKGMTPSKVFLDEFAYFKEGVKNSILGNFAGNESITIASTKSVTDTVFIELLNSATERESAFMPTCINWFDHPDRDHEFKKRMIAQIGKTWWDTEFS